MTEPTTALKVCTRCKRALDLSLFARSSKGDANGLRAQCRDCCAEYNLAWNRAHRERVNDSIRAYKKRRYAGQPAGERAQYATLAEQKRAWTDANPELVRAYKAREYRRRRDAIGSSYTTRAMVEARVEMFGGRCYYCGADAAGGIDHRIPLARGGSHWPANLVPCCLPCNLAKNVRTEAEYLRALKGGDPPPCLSL